jgi:hypothetical protein
MDNLKALEKKLNQQKENLHRTSGPMTKQPLLTSSCCCAQQV